MKRIVLLIALLLTLAACDRTEAESPVPSAEETAAVETVPEAASEEIPGASYEGSSGDPSGASFEASSGDPSGSGSDGIDAEMSFDRSELPEEAVEPLPGLPFYGWDRFNGELLYGSIEGWTDADLAEEAVRDGYTETYELVIRRVYGETDTPAEVRLNDRRVDDTAPFAIYRRDDSGAVIRVLTSEEDGYALADGYIVLSDMRIDGDVYFCVAWGKRGESSVTDMSIAEFTEESEDVYLLEFQDAYLRFEFIEAPEEYRALAEEEAAALGADRFQFIRVTWTGENDESMYYDSRLESLESQWEVRFPWLEELPWTPDSLWLRQVRGTKLVEPEGVRWYPGGWVEATMQDFHFANTDTSVTEKYFVYFWREAE